MNSVTYFYESRLIFPEFLLDDKIKHCDCPVCDGTMEKLTEEFFSDINEDTELLAG